MKFKRFMALALAGVMTMAMTGTAFAEGPDYITGEFGFTKTVTIGNGAESGEVAFTLEKYNGKIDQTDPASPEFDFSTPSDLKKDKFTFSDKTYSVEDITHYFKSEITKKPGVYNFKLSETTPDAQSTTGWGWTKKDSSVYYIRALVANTGDPKYIIYKGTDNSVGNKVKKIEFNNTYREKAWNDNKDASLTLKKVVPDTSYEEKNKEYTFDVYIVLADGEAANTTYEVKYDGATPARAKGAVAAGSNTIKLKAGETASFIDMPVGTTVTVTEKNFGSINNLSNVSFTGKINNSEISGSATASTGSLSTEARILGKEENTITFTNTYSVPTPTGLAISVAPFVAMFAAVGAAIALYVAAKRRVR